MQRPATSSCSRLTGTSSGTESRSSRRARRRCVVVPLPDGVVHVDRIGAARDRIVELPRLAARRRAVSVYRPTMRRDSRMPICVPVAAMRARSRSRERARRKNASSCIACRRASTSARVKSSGSSGSTSTTRVMFTVTSSGYGEMKNETSSRGTSTMPSSRARCQSVVQSRDGGERRRRALVRLAASVRIWSGCSAHVCGELVEVHVAQAEHQPRRLNAPALVALLRRNAGRSGDECVGGGVDRRPARGIRASPPTVAKRAPVTRSPSTERSRET